jgi:hypothetical protein
VFVEHEGTVKNVASAVRLMECKMHTKNASLFLNTESPQDNSKKIHSFIDDPTSLSWAVAAFSVTQSVGLLGERTSPSQGLYLHKGQHKHGINAHRHPYLERKSNPRPLLFEIG